MIDYWEALGRLATDAELHKNFEALKANQQAPQIVTIHPNEGISTSRGLNIPGQSYTDVQGFFSGVLTEQVMSVMSAGELIWTYSFDKTRTAISNINQFMGKAQPQLSAPSTSYYIALGRVMVDDWACKQLTAPGADTAKLLPRLSVIEQQRLIGLLASAVFLALLAALRSGPWDNGCDVAAIFWPGYVQPMGINANQDKSGKFVAFSRKAQQAAVATV